MSVRYFNTFLNSLKANGAFVFQPWTPSWSKVTKSVKVKMQKQPEGFLRVAGYDVFAWSISGVETTVVVRQPTDGFTCCFDMGYACRASLKCDNVLISHGHMDHISAIPQHNRKRELMGLKPSRYFMLPHLVDPITEVYKQFLVMNENCEEKALPEFVQLNFGDTVQFDRGYHARSFPTVHRVPSQGYILYKTHKRLKEELKGLPPQEIGARKQKGEDIHDISHTPEVAYTGDTTFEVFTNGHTNPDLLKVKLLIVEATYINNGGTYDESVNIARRWGHIDLVEFIKHADLFKDIENILLIHFSDRYSVPEMESAMDNLPDGLREKVFVATLAKERYL